MRLIETQTKWGNSYSRRYYVDGRRTSASSFDLQWREAGFRPGDGRGREEETQTGFRTVWETEERSSA